MAEFRPNIDIEKYLRSRRRIQNADGGRGYERGVRVFDCPLCKDTRGRGWAGLDHWGAGCFNIGCVAEPKLEGGLIEWVRRVERLPHRTETWNFLRREYGTSAPPTYKQSAPIITDDFCRFPPGMRSFDDSNPMRRSFEVFMQEQWGLDVSVARSFGLGWCLQGEYARRVVIPILMNQQPVGFQARTIADGDPKYLTSRYGASDDPHAECGRPAANMLFNIDSVIPEGEIVLVEGCADAIAWHRRDRARQPTAVAIMGVALPPTKLALLAARRPSRVVVALDDEPAAQQRAWVYLEDLSNWGLDTAVGHWQGGKDAGSGAVLEIIEPEGTIDEQVRRRLGKCKV